MLIGFGFETTPLTPGHHGNRATAHLQAPVNTTLNRKYQCVKLILTQKMWEGGGEKQASKPAEQLQQKHNAPADLPGPPAPDPGEMAALARF